MKLRDWELLAEVEMEEQKAGAAKHLWEDGDRPEEIDRKLTNLRHALLRREFAKEEREMAEEYLATEFSNEAVRIMREMYHLGEK